MGWPDELRTRGVAAGYGDVLIGACDVEGTDENGDSLCRDNHVRGNKLYRGGYERGTPEIYAILNELGVPWCSASCHWVGLDRQKMTKEQLVDVDWRCSWVHERWRDKHDPRCERLYNRFAECKCQ